MMKGHDWACILLFTACIRVAVSATQSESAESSWTYQDELDDPTNPFEGSQGKASFEKPSVVVGSSADHSSHGPSLTDPPSGVASPRDASPDTTSPSGASPSGPSPSGPSPSSASPGDARASSASAGSTPSPKVSSDVTAAPSNKETNSMARSVHSATREDNSKGIVQSGDVLFMKRVVNTFLRHLTQKSESGAYIASLTLDEQGLALLTKFSQSHDHYVQEASEAIASCINYIEPADPSPSYLSRWIAKHQNTIVSLLQILLIIIFTLHLLWMSMRLWQRMKWKQFLLFVLTVSFVVSVPWTWGHLYKQKLAQRLKRADHDFMVPPQCDAKRLSWTSFLFWSEERLLCEKYYEDQIVDPLWEIKPTMAVAYTFVEFVWKPLEVMGRPLGVFVRDLMEPLPLYMKPIVTVLGLMFFWWCMVLLSGMRVWTWFFTVEPAVIAQHQLTAMQGAVDNMQSFIEDTAADHARRDAQLKDALEAIERRSALEDNMSEILPVMYEMCADYGQQRNVRAAIIPACERADVSCQTSHVETRSSAPSASKHLETIKGAGDSTSFTESRSYKNFDLSHLDHIVLTTSNPQSVIDFYTKIGMKMQTFGDGRKALHFGQSKINIHKTGEEVKPHAQCPTPGGLDLCLICSCDVHMTLRQLKTNKIDVEDGPVLRTGAQGAITSVYIRDPDQNLIELAHYGQSVYDQEVETVAMTEHFDIK